VLVLWLGLGLGVALGCQTDQLISAQLLHWSY